MPSSIGTFGHLKAAAIGSSTKFAVSDVLLLTTTWLLPITEQEARVLLTKAGAGLSVAAAFAPWILLSAHQSGVPVATPPRIGFLGLRPMAEQIVPLAGLKEGLRDLGYIEGKNYVLETRVVDNDPARYPEVIRELAQLQVKLIVAASTPAAVAIHKENPAMPVVVRGPDIVGAGLAQTAAHPGGVVTGIDELLPGESRTRLRLLKQAVPTISRVAVLSSAPTDTGHATALAEAEDAATALGVTLRAFRVSATTNFDAVFADVTKDGAHAIFCLGGVLPTPVMKAIVDHAAQARLPAMYPLGAYVVLGGLMSHTYRNGEIFRAAATYVVQILRGAKPGDLPLTIWTKYYLTLNATTAASLGITLAPALLSQVDEVVK